MANKSSDLSNKVIAHWTVLERGPSIMDGSGTNRSQWLCRCKCGHEQLIQTRYFARYEKPDNTHYSVPKCIGCNESGTKLFKTQGKQ